MLGRSYGPAVMVSSCFEESTVTLTDAFGTGPGPARADTASSELHSIMRYSAMRTGGHGGIAPLSAVGQVTLVHIENRKQARACGLRRGEHLRASGQCQASVHG